MKVTRNVIEMKMAKAEEANTSMTMEQAIREVELKKLRDKRGINRSFVNPASHIRVTN